MKQQKLISSIIKFSLLIGLVNCYVINQTIAQSTPKGATISSTPDTSKKGNTWAVIVGISKYQNVQGLNYADKDALAFYDYLVNKKGIDKEHIQLLINEKAIASDIYGALDWLNLSIKENDRVIFYFSGHGDVETKTIYQNGFLLANDAPVAAYMTKGTINITFLQQYLETYIAKKAKDVLLIVDACRSGKLAGGSEGIQITMHSLGQTWNNQIIKVLSAQEGEASFEDKKWGGGRGVFSYYLVKGLEGLANKNADSVITTSELAAFLPFAVADATGSVQNPTVSGNPRTSLFSFNKDLLALANSQENQSLTGQLLAARGTMYELDPEVAGWYNQYRTYLQKGRLIWGEKQTDTINCAKHYYLKLVKDDRAKSLSASLKSSFIAALKHKFEVILDNYIKEEGKPGSYNYREAVKEIQYAFSLVDSSYILYNYLKARALFAPGTDYGAHKAINVFKKITQIEPDAAYAYNRLGTRFQRLNQTDSAMFYYKKAISISPTWPSTFYLLGNFLLEQNKYQESLYYLETGLKLDSTNSKMYIKLAKAYDLLSGNNLKGDSILSVGIKTIIRLIEKQDNKYQYYFELSNLYEQMGDNENKKKFLNKITKINPKTYLDFDLISDTYIKLKNYTAAEKTLKDGLAKWPNSEYLIESLQDLYYNLNNYKKYNEVSQNAVKISSDSPRFYYNLVCGYSLNNETANSLKYWDAFLSISKHNDLFEYQDIIDSINNDKDLLNVEKNAEFFTILKKYFPEYVR